MPTKKSKKISSTKVTEGKEREDSNADRVRRSSEGAEADERRLFYVALTRARKGVTITYARHDDSGKELLPSVFLNELKHDLVEKINGDSWDEKYKNDVKFQFGDRKVSQEKENLDDKNFVKDLFDRYGLSPTALNNYLECPWKYFYQNLIRIPSVQNKHMMYGTAIHGALEDFFRHMKNEGASKSFLLAAFENYASKQKFDERDLTEILEKGKSALDGWYDEYEGTWDLPSQMEVRIPNIEISDGVKINGKLDRVEFPEQSVVNVIDYKTGKPKSRNTLLGKTRSADGNYYRQLVFYKLLLKHYKDGLWSMQQGTIDFIEPDEKGKYKKEVFEIPDEDVLDLESKIVQVADEIINLKFWDKKCDDKDCEFCKLRNLLQ